MKLGDWLKKQPMTQAAFAQLIESDQSHVSDLVRGKVRPRLESVALIEQATKGQVQARDWLATEKKPARPAPVKLDKLKQAVRKVAR